ncbi:TIGR02301 family protein [Methylocystis sp. IM3]|uniref:TIGR02301 family protein n=1 Tax=unclassified Methylocystis TaxID=2625913 RepID=UPI0030F64020
MKRSLAMRRSLAFLALACVSLPSFEAGAQGIFDNLFGPDRPERAPPRPARDVPRADKEKKRPDAAAAKAKKKGEAAKGQPETAAKPGAPGGEAPPPPYEGQLVRLSEVLGALAFLRDLCQEQDGAEWRDKMSALIEAEAPSGPRRDKYVAAFNRGFHGYELTYRACTQNARDATARYLDEAAKISREVSYRFGVP